MFDANQMFKQKNLTPSSADQAEFVANFYERMLEEGQGDGVTRFSDDILFLISVFLCVVTSSVVCETGLGLGFSIHGPQKLRSGPSSECKTCRGYPVSSSLTHGFHPKPETVAGDAEKRRFTWDSFFARP